MRSGRLIRTREIEKFNKEHGFNILSVWSDKPVKIDFTYLRVVIRANEPIHTTIEVGFTDAENEKLEQMDCSIAVDLVRLYRGTEKGNHKGSG